MNTGTDIFEQQRHLHWNRCGSATALLTSTPDSVTDLIAASADGYVSVHIGWGDESIAPVRYYSTGSLYSSCFGVDDLNRGGHSDLAVGNIGGLSMSTLQGRGDSGFGTARVHSADDVVITCKRHQR